MTQNTANDLKKVQHFIYSDKVQKDLEKINNYLLPINVLEISGMGDQEIKHSNVLAWMFGDNQHQLGYEILAKFLGKVASIDEGINTDDDNLKSLRHYAYFPENERGISIKREWENIDLLIEDKKNQVVIVIENKIWAGESDKQIEYYEKATDINKYPRKKRDKDGIVTKDGWDVYYIFLTPDGAGVKNEGKKEDWLKADYRTIYNVVKNILDKSNQDIPDEARMILKSYNDLLIKENIVENDKLKELCKNIWKEAKYRDALNILIEHEPNGVDEFLTLLRKKLGEENIVNYNKKGNDFVVKTENYRKLSTAGDQESSKNKFWFGCYVTRSNICIQLGDLNTLDSTCKDNIEKKLQSVGNKLRCIQILYLGEHIRPDEEEKTYQHGKYNLTKIDLDKLVNKFVEILKAIDEGFKQCNN